MLVSTPTHDVFISYARPDAPVAEAIERGLERFAKPWYKRRALDVFRDKSSLTVGPDLLAALTGPIDRVRYVVLLASTHSAASTWVDREIQHCIHGGGLDRLLLVVLDGRWKWDPDLGGYPDDDPGVPPCLRRAYERQPLWVDLRGVSRDKAALRTDPRIADAVAQLAAHVRGVPKDELVGEDLTFHRRAVRTGIAAVAITTLLAVLAIGFAIRATAAGQRAERERKTAVAARTEAEDARTVAEAARTEAEQARDRAEAEARRNLAAALAATSGVQAGSDRALALLLAAEAATLDGTPVTRAALLGALAREDRARAVVPMPALVGDGPIVPVGLARSGAVAAVARARNGVGTEIAFVETVTGAELGRLTVNTFGIERVEFSHDGRRAAVFVPTRIPVADVRGEVTIVDVPARPSADIVALTPLRSRALSTPDYALSPDGRVVAAPVGADPQDPAGQPGLLVLDLATGEERTVPLPPGAAVGLPAFAPDGARLAVAAGDQVVVVSLPGGAVERSIGVLDPFATRVAALGFGPASDTLLGVIEGTYGSVTAVSFDLRTAAITTARLTGPVDPSRAVTVRVAPSGDLLAVSTDDTTQLLPLPLRDGSPPRIPGRIGDIDPTGTWLVTVGPAGRTARWSADGERLALAYDIAGADANLDSTGETTLAVVAPDGTGDVLTMGATVVRWRADPGPPLLTALTPLPTRLSGVSAPPFAVADDAVVLRTGDGPRLIRTGDPAPRGVEIAAGSGTTGRAPVLALAPWPNAAPTVDVVAVDPATGTAAVRGTVPVGFNRVAGLVAGSTDGRYAVVADRWLSAVGGQLDFDIRAQLADLSVQPAAVRPLPRAPSGEPVLAAFARTGSGVVVADGPVIRLLDTADPEAERELTRATSDVTALAFATDGQLVYGTRAGTVHLVAVPGAGGGPDTTSAPALVAPTRRGTPVRAVAADPPSGLLAVLDARGRLEVSDLATGAAVLALDGVTPTGGVSVDDGRLRAQQDALLTWDLRTEGLVARACAAAGRALTADEAARFLPGRPAPVGCSAG